MLQLLCCYALISNTANEQDLVAAVNPIRSSNSMSSRIDFPHFCLHCYKFFLFYTRQSVSEMRNTEHMSWVTLVYSAIGVIKAGRAPGHLPTDSDLCVLHVPRSVAVGLPYKPMTSSIIAYGPRRRTHDRLTSFTTKPKSSTTPWVCQRIRNWVFFAINLWTLTVR